MSEWRRRSVLAFCGWALAGAAWAQQAVDAKGAGFVIRAPEQTFYENLWVETVGPTGVEMEALTAVQVALLTIYDPVGLRVTASIPQYQLPQMRAVKQARVEFPELGRWVDATAVTLLPTADVATHVSQVRVGLPADLKGVIPGMFARVHFVVGRAQRMTVPAAALVRRGEVAAVYVQNEQGSISLRQLRLGEMSAGGEIEVLAGLTAGERVVLDPVKAAIALKSAHQGGK